MNLPKILPSTLRALFIGAVLGLSGLNAAAEVKEAFVLKPANQEEIAILLSDHPTFKFSGPNIIVEVAQTRIEVAIAKVERMGIENRDATAVNTAEASALRFDFSDGNTLRVYGLNPSSVLTAVSVDGRTLDTAAANADGYAEISLANAAPGSVTVINYNNNETIKYIKK